MDTYITPSVAVFNPVIPFQKRLIKDVRISFDYSKGLYECLLSGSIGSSKSTVAAHLAVTHCLFNPGARVAICRRSLPDIKRTIFLKCLEQLSDLKEGKDYFVNTTSGSIRLSNGSEIISMSFADKRYVKFRSVDLSAAVFEELIEISGDDIQAYTEVKMRIGRLPNVKEKWIISCTNPGGTSSYWYDYFFNKITENKKVYFSLTDENPFLPKIYIEQLKKELDPKLAKRMLYGQWVDLNKDIVYYAYNSEKQYLKNLTYEINPKQPITLSFDFNIGEGKPMSSCAYQYINDRFHVFDEVVVFGSRTQDVLDEWFEKGIFNHGCEIIVHGDATGKARDTRSILSDYDIIKKFLANIAGLRFRMEVPLANPPIKSRHNKLNAYCENELGQTRLLVYKDAKTVDEGLRLTALKKGGDYIEDDGPNCPYQHITTALGYGIYYDTTRIKTQAHTQRIR